ncbi:potassium channel family protein [Arthrobacter sp. QXT-31]|uniref:potassium channel family protein n=1 Tax=Arthrobacter sp. QXT-31 TaxID=1357915 RepID=UPI001F48F458|nr:potassium channel family protein [Arthrobacter sp. QXT-31]
MPESEDEAMDFWDVLWTVTGAGLILLMLVNVFYTLLYPHGSGPVCRTIMRGCWHLSKLTRGGASSIAAPVAMASVIGAWATMAVLGWALLYLPHLPEHFIYGDGVPRQADFLEAAYISMVTLSTVGFGEVVAGHPLLRLASAAQAVTGFGLLTATVSWILQMYPALNRRRALAATVTYAQELASEAKASDHPDLQFAGRMLEAALEDLARDLQGRFGHAGTTSSEVFEHYSTHHRHRRDRESNTR